MQVRCRDEENLKRIGNQMSQPKFPMIEQLGLNLHEAIPGWKEFIIASDLETLLEKGQRVYASELKSWQWSKDKEYSDTHTALLVNVQPIIAKEVTITREKLAEAWNKHKMFTDAHSSLLFEKIVEELGL